MSTGVPALPDPGANRLTSPPRSLISSRTIDFATTRLLKNERSWVPPPNMLSHGMFDIYNDSIYTIVQFYTTNNVWKQLKAKQRKQLTQVVSSLAIQMSGKRWYEWMSSFRKICFVSKMWISKMKFGVFGVIVLLIDVLSVSMRFNVFFCIYEHFKDTFGRAILIDFYLF